MTKKYFKKYTQKDADDAKNFVTRLSIKGVPGLLNSFGLGNFKKHLEYYVDQNDQYGFNRLADTYFKIVESGGDYNGKNLIKNSLRNLCRTMDKENLVQNTIRGTSAMGMLKKYSGIVGINVKYDIDGYPPNEVYDTLVDFLNVFSASHNNIVNVLDKKEDKNKSLMNFEVESRGKKFNVMINLNKRKITINSYAPSEAKPYKEDIIRKIETTLGDLFPKRESDLELAVSTQ